MLKMRSRQGLVFWVAPGGGIERGETPRDALARELWEEVGFELSADREAPEVWRRSFTFASSKGPTRQHERYFLVRAEPFFVSGHLPHKGEQAAILGHRWWTAETIAQASVPSDAARTAMVSPIGPERFAPRRLGEALAALLREVPKEPIDVGV